MENNNLAEGRRSFEVSHHDFDEWRRQQNSFTKMAGFTGGTFNLADQGLPERYDGMWISPGFSEILKTRPILGRAFRADDELPGAPTVLLIGHHIWQKRYGGDPDIVGREVRVNSEPATIIGVMPEGFHFPINEDAWMPLVLDTSGPRDEGVTLEVVARLRDGVTMDAAASEMATIANRLAEAYPETNEGNGTVVQSFMGEFIGEETIQLLRVMFVAVLLVLLIACFNVANLLIGRAATRSRELAIRSALGSSRWQTVAQVLVEAAVISVTGAVLGLGLARLALIAFSREMTKVETPFWFSFVLDGRAVSVALLATAGAALLSGLLPALQASRPNLGLVLNDAARGSTSFRLGLVSRSLVILEVALSCALLIGAGLTVRSVLAANNYDLRFDPGNMISARMGLFEADYPEESDWLAFFDRLEERVEAQPQVVHAAVASVLPTDTEIGSGGTRFQRPDETYETPRDMPFARLNSIGAGYFETLDVPLLAGRDFHAGDRVDSPPVAIVNEGFARREWPGQSPIGQRVDLWLGEEEETADPNAGIVEVVGMVPDLRFAEFDNADDQQGIYLPLTQQPSRFVWILARTKGDPLAMAEPLRRTVLDLDPNLPLYFVRSLEQVVEVSMFFTNIIGALFTVFGLVAALLACVGLYGVMSFAVGQRTQEMGVRMAFGARARDVISLILRQGVKHVSIGVVLGLGLGIGLAKALSAFLFQVSAIDPVTFVAVPLLLVSVALFACFVPARRASSVDPLEALRWE